MTIGKKLTVWIAYDMSNGEIHTLPEKPDLTLVAMIESKRTVEVYESVVEVMEERLVMNVAPGLGNASEVAEAE
jgi:hypothetical protein